LADLDPVLTNIARVNMTATHHLEFGKAVTCSCSQPITDDDSATSDDIIREMRQHIAGAS
jgi:hypothetical protein